MPDMTSDTRCMMPDTQCLVPDAQFLMPNACQQMTDATCDKQDRLLCVLSLTVITSQQYDLFVHLSYVQCEICQKTKTVVTK
jgi:hypothetical protein